MRSDTRWLKKLSQSTFKNGKWSSLENYEGTNHPFDLLREDLAEAVSIYNQNAETPIRLLDPTQNSPVIATLLHGPTQLRFSHQGGFLDISLIRTRNFQPHEQPLTRLTPMTDVFGYPVWKRGTTELSSDQVIKNALIHLLEASAIG